MKTAARWAEGSFVVAHERRDKDRYVLGLGLQFVALATGDTTRGALVEGCGKTVNISSSGMLFQTGQKIRKESKIWIRVNWLPDVSLGGPVVFSASGVVLRSSVGSIAVRLVHHGFTRGVSAARSLNSTPPMTIVCDTKGVYDLVWAAGVGQSYPVLRTDIECARAALWRCSVPSRLLLVTNRVREIPEVEYVRAYVIDTSSSEESTEPETFGAGRQIVRVGRPLDEVRFSAVLRATLEGMEKLRTPNL